MFSGMDLDVLEIEQMRLENEAVREDLRSYQQENATLKAALDRMMAIASPFASAHESSFPVHNSKPANSPELASTPKPAHC